MRVQAVSPAEPRQTSLENAATTLAAGGIVAMPTETFYGLTVDGLDPSALARVNRTKRKEPGSPILLLLADTGQVSQVADRLPALFEPLAERFWPGPLTLVIRSAPDLPPEIGGQRRTVAVRVPGLALPRRVAARLGRPITGCSANRHGEAPCRNASEVARTFQGEIDMILDGGPTAAGAPSTILDLTGSRPRVLREGIVPVFSLRPFLSGLALEPERP